MDKPKFSEALKFWIKLGFISFGGPAGQISIMHDYIVDKKKWISNSKFLHALNYCMLLPGPEAQQLATYLGWMLHGRLGGFLAGFLFIFPSMLILLALSIVYVNFGNVPWVYAIFEALKPAVVAIVFLALVKIAQKSLKNIIHYIIAVAAFVGIFFFDIRFPIIILGSILIAIFLRLVFPVLFLVKNNVADKQEEDENSYYINYNSVIPNTGFKLKRFLKIVTVCFVLWIIPFVLFYFFAGDKDFWVNLSLFFTQAAFVTFGGAYAVLPYVAQVSVEQFGWLTQMEMIDGLALGESTPGPLIMVLAFVGFMAGYNHFASSLLMGSIGLIVTTFYTFLPSFLFIFAGAPIIEKTQNNTKIKDVLTFVTAAVVGVILNLSIFFGRAIIFPTGFSDINFIALGWIVVSLICLYKFKISIIKWIAISAVFGLILHFLNISI